MIVTAGCAEFLVRIVGHEPPIVSEHLISFHYVHIWTYYSYVV